ncbi:MAG: LacI family DNA-binding transcriptional regulator [Lactobacillaceae bacterium]|jgi:LacI family transcriptional regulator|nr:LacI family DNA-binding transcriptional regulator [Lactobacillaceae bacterium]
MSTLKDVALQAGVSIATASRILNNLDTAKNNSTRQRVEKAAKQLNYTPNLAARGLANGATSTVGVVFGPSDGQVSGNDFGLKALFGIQSKLSKLNYASTVVSGKNWTEVYQNVRSAVEGLKVRSFILLYTLVDDPVSQYLDEQGVKYVVIGEPDTFTDRMYVDSDNQLAGYQGAQILINQLGVKKPLFISSAQGLKFETNRRGGYKSFLESKGIDYQEILVAPDAHIAIPAINYYVNEFGSSFDGIFATDDRLGFALFEAYLVAFNKQLPTISFNDSDLALIAGKNFHSFDVEPETLGAAAAELLFSNNGQTAKIQRIIIQAKAPEIEN